MITNYRIQAFNPGFKSISHRIEDWLFLITQENEVNIYSTTLKRFVPFLKDVRDHVQKAFDLCFHGKMLVLLSETKDKLEYFEVYPHKSEIVSVKYGIEEIPAECRGDKIIKVHNSEV